MLSGVLRKNPITGMADCCARTANGHAVAPPRKVMNSRRLMAAPRLRTSHRSGSHEAR
jgi:hypothetical protein